MIIKQHKITPSNGGDKHHIITIDWFNRDWNILINENHKQQIITAHLYDNNQWRTFDARTHEESVVYDWIKKGKIIKLKYKVQ
jgi:hypothetical protein